MITLYVDDLHVSGSTLEAIQLLKSELSKPFEMEDYARGQISLELEITPCRSE